jgi:MFS family permease
VTGAAWRPASALAAATVVNLPFGTLYAFSVFLKPLEALLDASRAQMSFVFGLATVTLVLGMNLAPRLYRGVPPAVLAIACGLASAAGLAAAATATSFVQFAVGYGLLFGPGAGVLFIVAQQAVNQTVQGARGLANGYVVSLYPLGAMLGAPVLAWAVESFGVRAALAGLGAVVLAACAVAAMLFRAAGIRMHDDSPAEARGRLGRTFGILVTVFFLAAAAGLMVLSQAAAIVQAYGGAAAAAVGATTLVSGAVGAARIAGGWLVDRHAAARVGTSAHACSLAGALLLGLFPGPATAVAALVLIGAGYGIVSGLAAGAIAHYWHRNRFGLVASRLYIAWCAAAISLPVLAGALFDRTGSYAAAVWIAAGISVLGLIAAGRLPARP